MKEEIQFRLGDSVYFPYHGYGTIIGLHNDGREYPIEVRWEASPHGQEVNTFTKDGFLTHGWAEWNVPSDSKLRDQLTVVDKSPLKKAEEMAEESKFKVGDRVYAPFHKYGTIVEIDDTDASYPITVKWDESRYKLGVDLSTFTEDGYLFFGNKTENTKITKVEGEKMGQIAGVIDHNIQNDIDPWGDYFKDESTIERMEEGLNKKVEDAVNPAHYKVEGLPEAIDIINHLMHREQYEGFLWGNILKYAYRFGRKGDKAETAGKIEWYAILVFGNKKDIICGFGKKAGMPPAHVNALKVIAIHPGAAPYIPQAGVEMYGDDSAELRIDTRLLIEVSTEEEVK